jgi:hypothetical protein
VLAFKLENMVDKIIREVLYSTVDPENKHNIYVFLKYLILNFKIIEKVQK